VNDGCLDALGAEYMYIDGLDCKKQKRANG